MAHITNIYKELCLIPSLSSAQTDFRTNIVQSLWSQRNLERSTIVKYKRTFFIPNNGNQIDLPSAECSNELLAACSATGSRRAVLRKVDNKQFLEVWTNDILYRCVDLQALDLHGSVYTDAEFKSFQWSPCENKLLYVAERKLPKTEPFYKRTSKDEDICKGDEYLYRQDWGEDMAGKRSTVIAIYNVEGDNVTVVDGVPDTYCPGQVIFSPDGNLLVGVAYKIEARKLGLVYCTNRHSTIFTLDFNGTFEELPLSKQAVRCLRFSPNGKFLIWLQRNSGGPHHACMRLMKQAWPFDGKSTTETLVPIVRNTIDIFNGKIFRGLYCASLPEHCFLTPTQIVCSTPQVNEIKSYIVNAETGVIQEIELGEGSHIVLEANHDYILFCRRHILKEDQLIRLKYSTGEIIEITPKKSIDALKGKCYEYFHFNKSQSSDCCTIPFNAIYLSEKNAVIDEKKLIAWPHGGPHGAFINGFTLEGSLMLSMGYSVLMINYRGSVGTGQDSIDYLLGKIGTSDVQDCLTTIKSTIAMYKHTKVGLFGGSHGGFLVAHLSGQCSELFGAVVSRNPVTEVASMSLMSDIPDWSFVESSNIDHHITFDPLMFLKMSERSPLKFAHKIQAPTLFALGTKDARVPLHQGLNLHHILYSNGIPTRVNIYEDSHALSGVANEMDCLINAMLWFQKYL